MSNKEEVCPDIIKNAVDQIIRYINQTNKKNQKLTFLFGAGINYNLSGDALNWNEFASNSIKYFLKSENKKYGDFELSAISKEIQAKINNPKVSLSFERNTKLNIRPFPDEKNEWFTLGYRKLYQKMYDNIDIFTLNYDRILGDLLRRNPVNLLEQESKESTKEIIHIHGVLNRENIVKSPSLLTLEDYVNNAKDAEKKFVSQISKWNKASESYQTIIIIGSTLQEEHILRAFNELKNPKTAPYINIILITHNDEFYFKKIKDIYKKLNIQVFNINSGQKYKDDFKLFWKQFSDSVFENYHSGGFAEISNNEIIDNDLYEYIKSYIKKGDPKITYKELFGKIGWRKTKKIEMIRPLYWLETHDEVLTPGSLKEYMMQMDEPPLQSLHFIKPWWNEFSLPEIKKILSYGDENLKSFELFGHDQIQYELESFIEFVIKKNDPNIIKTYKNISRLLIRKCLHGLSRMSGELETFVTKNYSYSEARSLIEFPLSMSWVKNLPNKNSNVYKMFKNDFSKNKYPLSVDIPENRKKMLDWIIKSSDNIHQKELFVLFLFDKYKKIIIKNIDFFVKNLDKKTVTQDIVPGVYNLHNILYFTLINTEYKEKYLLEISKIDCCFEVFPDIFSIGGFMGTRSSKFNTLDGEIIKEPNDIKYNEWSDVETQLQNKYTPKSHKIAILQFLKNNWSFEIYQKFIDGDYKEKIMSWGYGEKLTTINYTCKKLSEYKEYCEIETNTRDISFINISPPFDLTQRIEELSSSLDLKYSPDKCKELIEISEIKNIRKHYGELGIWLNSEIKIFIKYFKKKECCNIIYKILKTVFSWEEKNINELLQNKRNINDLNELRFLLVIGKLPEPPSINELIEFLEKQDQFDNISFETIDFVIRLNKDRAVWNNNFWSLIKFIKEDSNKSKFSNVNLDWKSIWYQKIIYNQIVKEVEPINGMPKFLLKDVSKTIRHMEEPHSFDDKIVEIIEKNVDFSNFNELRNSLWQLTEKKLGPKTISKYYNELMSCLSLMKNDEYIPNKKSLLEFFHSLEKKEKQKLANKLKEFRG